MASNPPGKCCTVGVQHEGTPKGQMIKVGDVEAYLATPAAGKAHADSAILYIADVFGIWPNSKLLADDYAANGYLCLVPDLFRGDPITAEMRADPTFDLMKWLTQGSSGDNPHTPPSVDPIVEDSIKYLKEQHGVKKLGAVGYCFGAKYVARHYKNGINCGFMAHPSFVDEDELAGFKAPLSIAAAETDEIFPAEKRHQSEVILAKKGDPYQIFLYSQVEHGFSVRCDLGVKVQRFAKEQAFFQAVQWFDNWLL